MQAYYGFLKGEIHQRLEIKEIDTRLRSVRNIDAGRYIRTNAEQFAARLVGQFDQFLVVPNNHGPWLVSQINRRCHE